MLLNQADPQCPGESDRGKLGMERTAKCKHDVLVTSPPVSFTHFRHRPPDVGPRTPLTTRGRWVAPVWRQFIYDWRLLKLSATVLDDWSCLMQPRREVHTHTHHGGIKQFQLFEHRREWRDVTCDKLTVGIEFHTTHCGLSDRRGWPDGAAPQTSVCPVLGTITKKSIRQIPIPPNTGKYWPIPNTPILVSFEP